MKILERKKWSTNQQSCRVNKSDFYIWIWLRVGGSSVKNENNGKGVVFGFACL